MTDSSYSFYTLPDEVLKRFEFEPVPFPVHLERAETIFGSNPVSLDALLDELDQFVKDYPGVVEKYESNAARLAMICATNNASNGDFMAALANLNIGLRIDPQHQGLKVHQALALQISGYTEAAAMEYERLLWDAPQAFDPLIRVLAAKAFMASGHREKALEMLEFLPECVFLDPSLDKLRNSLLGLPVRTESAAPELSCSSCGEPVLVTHKFCPACASPLSAAKQSNVDDDRQRATSPDASKKFCPKCDQQLKPDVKFCTSCGTPI